MARPRRQQRTATIEETFECPECGRTFTRAASLGAHRRRAHGVAGQSKRERQAIKRPSTSQTSRGRGRRSDAATATAASDGQPQPGVDRSALLKQVFPGGIPPRDDVVRRLNAWLDEAEQLARLK
jgi:uncharacterized C2H2 Zn-finger protein